MTKADGKLVQMFQVRITSVLHNITNGAPYRFECERCIRYNAWENAIDPIIEEPQPNNSMIPKLRIGPEFKTIKILDCKQEYQSKNTSYQLQE